MQLTREQKERYSRHLLLDEIGTRGQAKIGAARVLAIGAGGLGSPVLLYLAAAGVGCLGIADSDVVDLSNLQRQVIHTTADVSRAKVDSAAAAVARLNPEVTVRTHADRIGADNITDIIDGYDVVIDGTDNFEAKFLINDACVLRGVPFVHAGVLQFVGQLMTVLPGRSACYRCVFGQPPPSGQVPTSAQVGILGAVAGVIGTLQATEALKCILGRGELLANRLLTYDALAMTFRPVDVNADPQCPVCGRNPQITHLVGAAPESEKPAG